MLGSTKSTIGKPFQNYIYIHPSPSVLSIGLFRNLFNGRWDCSWVTWIHCTISRICRNGWYFGKCRKNSSFLNRDQSVGKISEFEEEILATVKVFNFERTQELRENIADFRVEIGKDYSDSKGFIFSQTASMLIFEMHGVGSPFLIGYTHSQLQP